MVCFDFPKWRSIGTSHTVLSWLRDGIKIKFHKTPEPFFHKNHSLNKDQILFVEKEIQELLLNKSIERVHYQPYCVSGLGTAPKKGEKKYRLIHDLREVNEHCQSSSFVYEDIRAVKKCVKKGDKLVTLDLKNGFHHIPIHPEYKDYFGFNWNDQFYRWNVLPFGWCNSPYFFGKTLKPVVQYLRSQGVRIVLYVDDFLILGECDKIDRHKDFVIRTLEALGWKINYKKSQLSPSYRKLFVGYIIDCENEPMLEVPSEKVKKLQKDIRRALKSPFIQSRVLARLAGICISVVRAVGPGKLMLRGVYRLLKSRNSWGDTLTLSSDAIKDLHWWLEELDFWNGLKINIAVPDIQITTDASPYGYGAVCGEFEASGFWTVKAAAKCQNYREMMAILVAIVTFKDIIRNKSVQILTDNFSALTYINCGGGPSAQLTKLAKAIFFRTVQLNASLTASFLAGRRNNHADWLSRQNPAYEWELDTQMIKIIDDMWGPHQVDRFASSVNHQLPVFNSRFWEPGTAGVDALAQGWTEWNNFVNPPFRMLDAVIEKIHRSKAEATVIAPFWPNQMWFQRMRQMLIAHPLRIPVKTLTMKTVYPQAEVLKNPKWRIYAWRVSGKDS